MTEDPLDIEELLAELEAVDRAPPEQPEYALASKPQREVTTPEELDEIAETEWPREPDEPCDDASCAVPEPQGDAQDALTSDPIPDPSEDDIAAYEPFPLPEERPGQMAPAVPDFSEDVWEDVELPRREDEPRATADVPVAPADPAADFPEFARQPDESLDAAVPESEEPEAPRPAATRREMPQPAAAGIPAFAGEQWEDVPLPQTRSRRTPAPGPVRAPRQRSADIDFPEFEPDEDLAAQVPSRVRETASSVPEPGDAPTDGPTARSPSNVPQSRDMGVSATLNVMLAGDRELADELASQIVPAIHEMRDGLLAQVQEMIESNTAVLDRSRGVV